MSTEPSIFTRIINREIPAYIVYEDEICIVILDVFPSIFGQSLVIPKQQVDYVFDLSDTIYQHLFDVAKKIALASDKAFKAERTCLVVEGFQVPHVHIRIYPVPETHSSLQTVLASNTEATTETLTRAKQQLMDHL